MSEFEKAVGRLLARPPQASFADVRRVLEGHGWRQGRQKGSHVTFTKEGERSITVPLREGDKVQRVYVREICERLDLGLQR